jgi:dCMP deaminase
MADTKLSWDYIWMELAHNIASRSNDPRLKVGAVIVTQDNECILSIGYNGDEKGGKNCPDSLEPGKSNFIHAEVNAIAKMNYADPRPRKLYLTHSPCVVCCKLIVNANIEEVIWCEEYRDQLGLDILKDRGIIVRCCERWE